MARRNVLVILFISAIAVALFIIIPAHVRVQVMFMSASLLLASRLHMSTTQLQDSVLTHSCGS
jgi:hypothetical protein